MSSVWGRTPTRDVDMEVLAVWAYRDQQANLISRGAGLQRLEAEVDRVAGPGVSACGSVGVAELLHRGCSVEGGGFRNGALHPDAEVVHGVVCALSADERGMVIDCGRLDSRPDWMEGKTFRMVPVLKPSGKKTPIYDQHRHVVGYEVRPTDRFEYIDMRRRQYKVWHRAMTALTETFMQAPSTLRYHRVTGFKAPASPWSEKSALDRSSAASTN